jgi:hypothetical protein
MDSVANYPQRAIRAEPIAHHCPHRLGRYNSPLNLLIAFGVLAFILSATSPHDDDIQQDCCRSRKSKPCVLANYKTVSNLRTFRICTVRSMLAPPLPLFASYVTAYVSVPEDEIKGIVCSSMTGDRSPPTKSS